MIVISLYRPPSTSIDVFMNNMLDIITWFQNVPTCIVGDFNENVAITSNTHCCTMLRLQGFQQMISKPTHNSGTIIDHVYVSHTLNTIQTYVTDCYYSDYDCILCVITVLLTCIIFLLNTHIDIINIIWYMLRWIKYLHKCTNVQTYQINVNLTRGHIIRLISTS